MKNLFLGLLCMFAVIIAKADTLGASEVCYEEAVACFSFEVFDTNIQTNAVINHIVVDEMAPGDCTVSASYNQGCENAGSISVTAGSCNEAMATLQFLLKFVPAPSGCGD